MGTSVLPYWPSWAPLELPSKEQRPRRQRARGGVGSKGMVRTHSCLQRASSGQMSALEARHSLGQVRAEGSPLPPPLRTSGGSVFPPSELGQPPGTHS